MRVGAFRRISAFLFDALPIYFILYLLFIAFVGEVVKPETYDETYADFVEIQTYYYGFIEDLNEQYTNGDITEEEYQAEYDNVMLYYNHATEEHIVIIFDYFARVVSYYLISFVMIYYFYSLILKGRTYGRRILGLELGGNVNWRSLFMREVIWKLGYWLITLVVGGVLLDIAMISFSRKKLAPRDIVSGLYVKYEGVDYPF